MWVSEWSSVCFDDFVIKMLEIVIKMCEIVGLSSKKVENVHILPLFRVKPPYSPPYMQIWGKNGLKMNKKWLFWPILGCFWPIFRNIWSKFANIWPKLWNILTKPPPNCDFMCVLVWFWHEMCRNWPKIALFCVFLCVFMRFMWVFMRFTSNLAIFPPYMQFGGENEQKWPLFGHKSSKCVLFCHILLHFVRFCVILRPKWGCSPHICREVAKSVQKLPKYWWCGGGRCGIYAVWGGNDDNLCYFCLLFYLFYGHHNHLMSPAHHSWWATMFRLNTN